ncbi:MAG: hypothetical protein CMB80_30370 [Flammeovirgaceae bacterium]|nr:hypothetical protein [Flammeovirgaceae bacterium]MBE60874.1 hypothetical protein [Flammeovirgaceae bacterium]HCX22416.1 hypothetical protein [Cytophagales bacterium]|tara:strand:- start:206 stop:808 length:603 start_codon:yes stop_codon:yes gene_type:complete
MRKSIFVIFLCLFALKGIGQEFSNEIWHDGYLVTSDQDTLSGLVKYDMESNIVQVIHNQVVKTFSSHKLFYVEIYDKVVSSYRQFYSIPYNVNYNYKIPILFEVLYEGPLSLLSREAIVQETTNSGSAYWGSPYVRNVMAYTFYFLDKEGNIDMFTGKKADLITIMSKHGREIKEYVKENKLKPDEVRDLIRITAFYNSL